MLTDTDKTTKQNSRVFVSSEHACWDRPKLHKKFGTLIKSSESGLHDVLMVSKQPATSWLKDRVG